MGEVTYVEVLGRHGEVVARHRSPRLPITIGRAYDNDVILDDPYVAPHHAIVKQSSTGGLELVDAGSQNGLFVVGTRHRVTGERVNVAARYRVGRTEVRIRTSNDAVPAELLDVRDGKWLPSLIPTVAIAASAGMLLLYDWSVTYERGDSAKLVLPSVMLAVALLLWSGAWSLAGRLLRGEWRFAAHLTASALLVMAYFFVGNWDYLQFALSWPPLLYPGLAVLGVFVAWSLWRHLSLVSRNSGWGIAVAAVTVTAVSVGWYALQQHVDREDDLSRMAFSGAIKPPAVRLVQGRDVGEFFRDAERLKGELEPLKSK